MRRGGARRSWAAAERGAAPAMQEALDRIVEFLLAIGIPTRPGPVAQGSFLSAIRVVHGGLVYDPQHLRWPGDLLHEAGHIAVTPAAQRAGLNDALDGAEAAAHGGELEAMAWSWAALVYLGLPGELLFHAQGYKGQSAGLLLSYSMGVCPGATGLASAGMTLVGEAARASGQEPYPRMRRWLR